MIRNEVVQWLRRGAVCLVLGGVLASGWASPAGAREGDSRGELFVGTTSFAAGGDSTFGTTFGFNYGTEIENDLMWSVAAAFSTTEGEAVVDGQTHVIEARTTMVQTGLTAFFNRGRGVVPFIGGGPSIVSYEIDFDYPGSEVGKTAGTGLGVFGQAGLEIRLGRNTMLIPQYRASVHSIKTEDGNTITLFGGGLVIALRIGV